MSGLAPILHPVWVDESVHASAVASLLAAGRRGLSLVDCTSFELMRRNGLDEALALDRDFVDQGFGVSPGSSSRD